MTSVGFPQRADFLVCISDRDAYNNAHSIEAENYMKFQIHLVTGAFFLAFGLNRRRCSFFVIFLGTPHNSALRQRCLQSSDVRLGRITKYHRTRCISEPNKMMN